MLTSAVDTTWIAWGWSPTRASWASGGSGTVVRPPASTANGAENPIAGISTVPVASNSDVMNRLRVGWSV